MCVFMHNLLIGCQIIIIGVYNFRTGMFIPAGGSNTSHRFLEASQHKILSKEIKYRDPEIRRIEKKLFIGLFLYCLPFFRKK